MNIPVCKRAKIAPKAPPDEIPRRCGSASIFRVTACRHTIACSPWDQVCSISPGQTLFERIPQTVPLETGTVPIVTAKEREISSTAKPPMLKSDRPLNLSILSLCKEICVIKTNYLVQNASANFWIA